MSIVVDVLTGGSNNHETTSEAANGLATDFVTEGVVGAITNTSGVSPATGGFAVNEASSPDMTVDVSAGVAYVTATPTSQGSQVLRVKNSATESVSISANSSGSTKYDWIYISISASNAANPNAAGDNVATLVTSRSTSSSSDDGTPPTYGYPIAVVTVANGASSIVNANITDKRVRTGAYPDTNQSYVTNSMLDTTAGELGGAWQSWTPTFTNATTTGGTIVAKYRQIGKKVDGYLRFTLGAGSAITGTLAISPPVSFSTDYTNNSPLGTAQCDETTVTNWGGLVVVSSGTFRILVDNGQTDTRKVSVNATKPFTWATGDILMFSFSYEAA